MGRKSGKLFLQIRKFDQDFLLVVSLPYGLGSNDIGLDRGRLGEERIVHFTRVGPRVLLVAPNLQYRSSSADPMEKLAVKQSLPSQFWPASRLKRKRMAQSWSTQPIFFCRILLAPVNSLSTPSRAPTSWTKSAARCAGKHKKLSPQHRVRIDSDFHHRTSSRTLAGSTVTPDAHAVTLREHYSFIQLPDDGYQPRAFDPRSGFFDTSYRDYSAPLGSAWMCASLSGIA